MSNTTDPLTLFGSALAAVQAEDWLALARLCDPASLRSFQRQLIQQYSSRPAMTTADELIRHNPELPRAVAEYYAEEARRHSDPLRRLREEMPGLTDLDSLRALSAEDAFGRWLESQSPRRQIERLGAAGRIPADMVGPIADTHPGTEVSLVALGFVLDGDQIAHVLYRETVDEIRPQRDDAQWLAHLPDDEQELARALASRAHPRTTTCRRQPDGSWRLIADHDLLGVGSTYIDIRVAGEPRE